MIRRKYVDFYLFLLFTKFLSKTKANHFNIVRLECLALLIDSVKCPIKANLEAIYLCNVKWNSLSFREKLTLNSLRERAINLFELIIMSSEKTNSSVSKNGFYHTETDLFDIIKFDTLLSKFSKITRNIYL